MAKDPDKGWQLPTVVNPSEYWCYRINIPKDIAYLRAFRGAIGQLDKQWNWQRDVNHTASQVAQVWLEQILEADTMLRDGDCDTVDCNEIIDCINETIDLQQLIAQYSNTSSVGDTDTIPEENFDVDLMGSPVGCDNDNIYGMAIQLVEFLDRIAEDILEFFVNAPTAISRLGDIIEAIPVIGELPGDDAFQFVESVLDDWNQAYQSAFTQQLKEEIACDLFCIAQSDCELSMRDVWTYYYDKLAGMNPQNDFLQFIEDVLAYNWIGVATVYGLHLFIVHAMIVGGEVVGFDIERLKRIVQAMFNDPDSDWQTICDACPDVWQETFDFTTGEHGWDVVFDTSDGQDRGEYVAGVGFRAVELTRSNNETAIYIFQDNLVLNTVTEVTITGTFTGDNTVTTRIARMLTYDSGQQTAIVSQYTPPNSPTSLGFAGQFSNYGMRFDLYMSGYQPSPDPIFTMQSMTIKGTGTNPFTP